MIRWRSTLLKHWFLLGIITSVLLAKLAPWIGAKGGLFKPEITVKYLAVSFIFFNSGLSLQTKDLMGAVLQCRLHLFIQLFTLLGIPVLINSLVDLLQSSSMDHLLLKGLLVVGSMPPPVSSAVILTKSVGGNEAGAIFNSAFGSFLGIIITPMWLLHFLGLQSGVSLNSVFLQLSLTVLLPLLVGQLFRCFYLYRVNTFRIPFGTMSSCTLLLIIYTTFCDTFLQPSTSIDPVDLTAVILLVVFLQCILMGMVFVLTTQLPLGLSPQDTVACLFSATHKSLTLGIPILKLMFEGEPELSVISIPLLVYHPTQILLGGLLVPSVRSWMQKACYSTRRRTAYDV